MSQVVVPEGQSPPFEVVDDQHHGAWVIITAALGLAITLVCLLIRIYVRIFLSPPFGPSDWIVGGASATAAIQSIIIFVAVHHGFGTSIELLDSSIVTYIQNTLVAGDVFYLISLYLAKASVVAMFLRLTPQKQHNLATWITGAICSLWLTASILVITIGCEANKPWAPAAEHCKGLFPRWQFISAVDIITEILFFALSAVMVHGIQTSLSRKIVVLSAFFSRLPIIIFSALRLHYQAPAIQSLNPTLAFIEPYIWAECAMHYSLIACTVFCLRPFMMAVSTSYGTAGDENLTSSGGHGSNSRTNAYGSNSRSGNNSYALKSMTRSFRKGAGVGDGSLLSTTPGAGDRLDDYLHAESRQKTTISSTVEASRRKHAGHDGSSVGSNESTKMIIRKDVHYTVQYQPRKSDGDDSDQPAYGANGHGPYE